MEGTSKKKFHSEFEFDGKWSIFDNSEASTK